MLCILAAISLVSSKRLVLNSIDISVLLAFISTVLATYHTLSMSLSLIALCLMAELAFAFAIVRSYPGFDDGVVLFAAVCTLGVALDIQHIYQYCSAIGVLRQLGQSDFSQFRRVLGVISDGAYSGNEPLQYLLFWGMGGIVAVQYWKKSVITSWAGVLCNLSSWICLLLSFSRLVYLAVITSLIVYWILQRPTVKAILINIGCLATLSIVTMTGLGIGSSIAHTVLFTHTESQQRSLSGRWMIWRDTVHLILEKWPLGGGSGTLPVQLCREERGIAVICAPQAFNWYLQVLSEQGSIGFILWLPFFFCPLWWPRPKVARTECLVDGTRALIIASATGVLIFLQGQSAVLVRPELCACEGVWLALIAISRREVIC